MGFTMNQLLPEGKKRRLRSTAPGTTVSHSPLRNDRLTATKGSGLMYTHPAYNVGNVWAVDPDQLLIPRRTPVMNLYSLHVGKNSPGSRLSVHCELALPSKDGVKVVARQPIVPPP